MTNKNIVLLLSFSIIIITLIVQLLPEKRVDNLLEKSTDHYGIIIKIKRKVVHSPGSAKIRYWVNGSEYTFWASGDYTFLELGDTVLIEYSKKDNSVARVTNKRYAR